MTTITSELFGTTSDGRAVTRYTMKNSAAMRVSVLDYGCTVQSIAVPDAAGRLTEVVLGYDDVDSYERGTCFFGATVGRYANRIGGARFSLGGQTYELSKNDGENHLHGAWCTQVFGCEIVDGALAFRHVSPPEEEGYPGAVSALVRFRLTEDNALRIEYEARTDADTVINLTNHAYFNLNGVGDVLGHRLRLCAGAFCEGGAGTLPTGRILPVDGTPMDFRAYKTIGAEIGADYEQLVMCRGYDHNYVLDGEAGRLRRFAEAAGEKSGITMECFTTQPGVQLYTGNYVDEDAAPCGRGGVRYGRYAGFCLETQHYPDSPNRPEFPGAVLRPGEIYSETTVYRYDTEDHV